MTIPTVTKEGKPTTVQAKPQTTNLALDPTTGTSTPKKEPVEIPRDVKWSEPKTVVQAAPEALKGPTSRSVVTFMAGSGKAVQVSDGDTARIKLDKDNSVINCRIDKINAPETAKGKKPAQPFGNESKKALEDLMKDKSLKVSVAYSKDRYGRSLCQIELESGEDVSTEMIRNGMAQLYDRYAKDPDLKTLQDTAKKEKRGLWSGVNPLNAEKYNQMNYWTY